VTHTHEGATNIFHLEFSLTLVTLGMLSNTRKYTVHHCKKEICRNTTSGGYPSCSAHFTNNNCVLLECHVKP